jgi:hypothetical protein
LVFQFGAGFLPCSALAQSERDRPFPFPIGEKLTFDIKYFGVTAGQATLHVVGPTRLGPHKTIQVQSRAKTVNVFDKIYSVNDRIETFLHPTRLSPHLYRVVLREGNYKRDKTITFDQADNTAIYIKNVEHPLLFEVTAGVQDPLSALYYLRTKPLSVGKPVTMKVFDDKKLYDMEVQILKKETIPTFFGSAETLMVKPLLQSEGIFKRTGDIYVWLSDDEHRVPLKMKSEIKIGAIDAEISKIEGVPGYGDLAKRE